MHERAEGGANEALEIPDGESATTGDLEVFAGAVAASQVQPVPELAEAVGQAVRHVGREASQGRLEAEEGPEDQDVEGDPHGRIIRTRAYDPPVASPDPRPQRPPLPFDRKANPMLKAARYTGAGLEFAVAVGLFTWLGHWADGRFGTDPWWTVIGALVGVAAGTWVLVRPFLLAPRKGEDEGRPGG